MSQGLHIGPGVYIYPYISLVYFLSLKKVFFNRMYHFRNKFILLSRCVCFLHAMASDRANKHYQGLTSISLLISILSCVARIFCEPDPGVPAYSF